MTTAAEPAAQSTPAPVVTATTTPAAPAVVPPAAPPAASSPPAEDPHWLAPRLERQAATAKAALLAELGIDDPAKAKAFIDAGKAAENEKKSLADKLSEHARDLAHTKAQAERYSGIIALQAAAQMGALTAEQQAAVKAIAGEDPAEQLRAVVAFAPTWAAKAPAEPTPKPITPPATTVPTGSAPPSATTSPTDHKAVFKQLEATNPFAAAQYAQKHPSVWSD